MRIVKKTQKLLIVKQDPSTIWLIFGGCFLFGGYQIYKTLTGVPEDRLMGLICIFGMCAIGLFGTYMGYGYSTIELNKETGKAIYIRKGLFSSERAKFDLSGINSVYASENPWDFGNDWPYSSIVISIKNKEFELYTPFVWSLKINRQIADEISYFLNIPQSDPK